jgi:hypothetical protein
MSYQAIPNLITHEIQVTEGIHLSDESRRHIERLVMEAIRKESKVLSGERDYWRNLYFSIDKSNK